MSQKDWIVYTDYMGDKKMLVRVNAKYKNAKYKHTYIISYDYKEKKGLPTFLEKKKIYKVEDYNEKIIKTTFEDQVVYLGTATFGGKFYLVYASDLNIKWKEFVKFSFHVDSSYIYLNDNMNYYHKVLLLD